MDLSTAILKYKFQTITNLSSMSSLVFQEWSTSSNEQNLLTGCICRSLAETDKLSVCPISHHSLARAEQAIQFAA